MKNLFYLLSLATLFFSCADPELDALMDDYCDCINRNKNFQAGQFECIELMDSIQAKYENQPRKLNKVLEKTNECY